MIHIRPSLKKTRRHIEILVKHISRKDCETFRVLVIQILSAKAQVINDVVHLAKSSEGDRALPLIIPNIIKVDSSVCYHFQSLEVPQSDALV